MMGVVDTNLQALGTKLVQLSVKHGTGLRDWAGAGEPSELGPKGAGLEAMVALFG